MNPLYVALTLGVALILLGAVSAYFQLRGRRQLLERHHVPSDEFTYLRGRYRRRLVAAGIMCVAGVMIPGAYLSGMVETADTITPEKDANGDKKPIADQDKQFLRLWTVYWIAVVLLAGAIVCIGIVDAVASRRYWLGVYREMKEEHQVKLRRDLAVYRQQKDDRGAHRGKL
jgi:hypothetical protein